MKYAAAVNYDPTDYLSVVDIYVTIITKYAELGLPVRSYALQLWLACSPFLHASRIFWLQLFARQCLLWYFICLHPVYVL